MFLSYVLTLYDKTTTYLTDNIEQTIISLGRVSVRPDGVDAIALDGDEGPPGRFLPGPFVDPDRRSRPPHR